MTHIPERDYDGRTIVHSTPRYRGSTTCFTGQDDSQSDSSKVWGGMNMITMHHEIGDSMTKTVYFDLNMADNKTYLLTGLINWKDALLDRWSCSIVPKTTTYTASTNTNYTLFGGYLILPAAGDGTINVNVADMNLVEITQNEYGKPKGAGYWDADYNTTTKVFENITANALGTGKYNMFGAEIVFSKYVNNYALLGSSSQNLTSFDADQLGHNMRLKFLMETMGTDHEWWFCGNIVMFRDKTV